MVLDLQIDHNTYPYNSWSVCGHVELIIRQLCGNDTRFDAAAGPTQHKDFGQRYISMLPIKICFHVISI